MNNTVETSMSMQEYRKMCDYLVRQSQDWITTLHIAHTADKIYYHYLHVRDSSFLLIDSGDEGVKCRVVGRGSETPHDDLRRLGEFISNIPELEVWD